MHIHTQLLPSCGSCSSAGCFSIFELIFLVHLNTVSDQKLINPTYASCVASYHGQRSQRTQQRPWDQCLLHCMSGKWLICYLLLLVMWCEYWFFLLCLGRFPDGPCRQTEALQTLHCGLLWQFWCLQVRLHVLKSSRYWWGPVTFNTTWPNCMLTRLAS